MARVTVEDCMEVVNNRYELVLLAAQRARDIGAGAPLTVERDNDKNPVVALREIADRTVSLEQVRDHIVNGVNRMSDLNEEDEALLALANAGLEPQQGATAAMIEDVVFDANASLAAAEEDMGEFEGLEGGFDDLPAEEFEVGPDMGADVDFEKNPL